MCMCLYTLYVRVCVCMYVCMYSMYIYIYIYIYIYLFLLISYILNYMYNNNCYVCLKCKSIKIVISRDTIMKHFKLSRDVPLCICSFSVLLPDSDTISHYNPLKALYIMQHVICMLVPQGT